MQSLRKTFEITVERVEATDTDPAGYVATNSELGLVVEADTLDELTVRIQSVAVDLFELNVLPSLQAEVQAEIRPAFSIKHFLSDLNCGDLLPGFGEHATA